MSRSEVHASARSLTEEAFNMLYRRTSFVRRDGQIQLGLMLSDLIESEKSGLIEAPTGSGKSLAALVPAIANAIASGKRTVISTYTNVLAEQYWHKDLPIALSLFDGGNLPSCAFLIGRQRYVCQQGLRETMPTEAAAFISRAQMGIDTEFRKFSRNARGPIGALWAKVSVPPVCPARFCSDYESCWLYEARRKAEKAQIVITNHSVVIQDALNAKSSDTGYGMLGKYDFLIVDEGHDMIASAQSGLEFDLSAAELRALEGMCGRIESTLLKSLQDSASQADLKELCADFRSALERIESELLAYGLRLARGGVLLTSPPSLCEHPAVKSSLAPEGIQGAQFIAGNLAQVCGEFTARLMELMDRFDDIDPDSLRLARDTIRNYANYIGEMGAEALALLQPFGVMVSYASVRGNSAELRSDTVGLAEPLDELLWSKRPYALLSATLAVDGEFTFIKRTLGCSTDFEEVMESPFDFASQAAVYLPPLGSISDPTQARKNGTEPLYYDEVAQQISQIIVKMGGRTMALFHSRREMEEVHRRLILPPGLPVFIQPSSGFAAVGEQFREEEAASLFGVRSFWTGFDAPGPTLSCVAIVRIPFEVPIEPPALARMAHLAEIGLEPFGAWTLPMAKMMVRQGAGRLIRSAEDTGVIAILDPRLRTKRYGEEMIGNLPDGVCIYSDFEEALARIGWNPDNPRGT